MSETPETDAAWAVESGNGLNEVKEISSKHTKLAEISSLTESIVERANELIARWDQPSWKDTAPTARFINALRIAVRAYEEKLK
jgi:hypothetical protein